VPIAGPVFTEWYWTPLFFTLFYGPPALALAGVLYALGRFTRLRRRTRALGALALAPALLLTGVAVAGTVKYRRTEAADARQVSFATFAAPGLHQTSSSVLGGPFPVLHLTYARGRGELLVSQVAAEDDDLTPPACFLHDGTPYHAWDGPCRAARTPRGRLVTLADIDRPSLAEVRDGTLIVAGAYGAGAADLLAIADALEPVDVADIHWER
jgi:hypothetical protein